VNVKVEPVTVTVVPDIKLSVQTTGWARPAG
jgi:hypothetical protein